jgi:hypothetical protein
MVSSALHAHGSPVQYTPGQTDTLITTIYLDTEAGTWTHGHSPTKLRLRSYQESERWWFELKRRDEDVVDKKRRPMTVAEVVMSLNSATRWTAISRAVGSQPLQPVFAVRCSRTAFEWPRLRVTMDRNVEFFDVHATEPLTLGCKTGEIAGEVIEVKSRLANPDWLEDVLNGHRLPGYSKSRYALALTRGVVRPFLQPIERKLAPGQ